MARKYHGVQRRERLASLTPDAVARFVPSNEPKKGASLFSEENSLIYRLNSLLRKNNSLFD